MVKVLNVVRVKFKAALKTCMHNYNYLQLSNISSYTYKLLLHRITCMDLALLNSIIVYKLLDIKIF